MNDIQQKAPNQLEQVLAALIFPRMGLWLYISIALCALIWFLAPHMVKVGAYKLALITVAAFIGYHINRALESRGWRPHNLVKQANMLKEEPSEASQRHSWECAQLAAAAYQRRAWVVSACMIAAALGS